MMLPTTFSQASPLWRVQALLQTFVLGRPGAFDLMFVDLRLAIVALIARSLLGAADAVVRHVMGRAWQGARFAQDITAAATMVAAAGR
ncbi:hypothetical protein QA640_40885 [Bradyrhizobium sp. CB82]|uniref:hypothetical protein n=1 Tax=Bradyrhizobium sp. CB82 TaxID=3039159 RepID=UPI0024B2153C|nr:hypothetical protein [Bradyrhizobium sp. CB82]WFU40459.1 hypothetical protein QA640_40885 [Bradyrhizobium sp. CB82]